MDHRAATSSGFRIGWTTFKEAQQPTYTERKFEVKGCRHSTIQNIAAFLDLNSREAANQTRKFHGQHVAARILNAPFAELHRNFCTQFGARISTSTFRKHLPPYFIKPRKKTDYCDHCFRGQNEERALNKLLEQREQGAAVSNESINALAMRATVYRIHKEFVATQKLAHDLDLRDLSEGECVLIIDFKENVRLEGSVVVSQSFYDGCMRSVFGALFIYLSGGQRHEVHVNVVSECLNHDFVAAINSMDTIFASEWFHKQSFHTLKLWTDCGNSFRSYSFSHYVLRELTQDRKLFNKVQWNLFAEKHGKSLVDGHFSVLSRWLTDRSKYLDHNSGPFNTTQELIDLWTTAANHSLTGFRSEQKRFMEKRNQLNVVPDPNFEIEIHDHSSSDIFDLSSDVEIEVD